MVASRTITDDDDDHDEEEEEEEDDDGIGAFAAQFDDEEEEEEEESGYFTDEFDEEPVDGDVSTLINFQNLENLVQHFLEKFKRVDSRLESVESNLEKIQEMMQQNSMFESCQNNIIDLKLKMNTIERDHKSNTQKMSTLEDSLDRNKILVLNMEKHIELVKKEKLLADKTIAELHELMLDKATISELHIFEAKFAGYATRGDFQELMNKLLQFSRTSDLTVLTEKMDLVENRFDDYTRTVRMDEEFETLRDWINRELTVRPKEDVLTAKLTEASSDMRSQKLQFKRSIESLDDKLKSQTERLTQVHIETQEECKKRALQSKVDEINERLKDFALRSTTESFQKDILPRIKLCIESIEAFDTCLVSRDMAIQRVDEVLLDKSSKYDIMVLNSRMEKCLQKEESEKIILDVTNKLDTLDKRLEHYVAQETSRFKQFRPPDHTATFEMIKKGLAQKAEKCDLVELYTAKSNRLDTDKISQLQQKIHQQLEYMAITNLGLAKLVLGDDSKKKMDKMQQKALVLMQSEALWNWVMSNEPPPNLDSIAKRKEKAVVQEYEDPVTRKRRLLNQKQQKQLEQKLGIKDENQMEVTNAGHGEDLAA